MNRGYQPDFITLNPKVRDPGIRRQKAEKIRWALETYAGRSLDNALCLDIGCSSGLMTAQLADLFQYMLGLDYDSVALGAIREHERQSVRFLRGDAMRLPLPDGAIELVICAQIYEHVPSDNVLFKEIYRVLAPRGVVFFSGPNWLFPIEPHYYLPFLHWLPKSLAARYVQLAGLDNHYYEQLRTYWHLRRLTAGFEVQVITHHILSDFIVRKHPNLRRLLHAIPDWIWMLLEPLTPNFNWILRKPDS